MNIQHHTPTHALSTYLADKMVITKTENFNLFRCDRRFVSLNVVHLFKMVKTCNSGIIHKQKGERDQFLILLFDHQWPCNQLLLMYFVVTCSKPISYESTRAYIFGNKLVRYLDVHIKPK